MTDSVFILVVPFVVAFLLAAIAFNAYCTRRRADANRRADVLLRELLTPDELDQLERDGYLAVPSGTTPGRIYRIPARPGLVAVVDAGRMGMRLCLQPVRSVPEREHALFHKLLLEGAEREYWDRPNCLIDRFWRIADEEQVEVWTGLPPGVLSQR